MPVGTEPSLGPGNAGLRIGDWTVEPALDQLSSAGRTVKLEPKVMSVLVCLADRAGQVVSREALLSAAWPGVVVGDDSLTQVIIKLRKALGDTPERPAYIQTIAKRGYRLVADVMRREGDASLALPPQLPTISVAKTARVRWLAAAAMALLLVAAGAWWLDGGGIPRTPAPLPGGEAASIAQPTVGIKPFEALGDDPQAGLLAQGITADLVTDLSKVFGLRVIGVAVQAEIAAAEPPARVSPVRYLVSGSVQRVEGRLRLHVQLTDMSTGTQLWAERFDRAPESFFAIQEELGGRILRTLPAKVSEAELRRVAQRYTGNLQAYEYFQRGQSALLARQKAENDIARTMFRGAIALDASFARAYAGLALTYAAEFRNGWAADGGAALDRALELAKTANQIDPDIAETLWVLAFVHMERRQHAQALEYLQTAVRLYPSYADGYALMGGIETYVGRPTLTVPLVRTAMRLNPQGGYLYFLLLGRAYLFLGDLEQARINLEQALLRNPVDLEAHVYMAALDVASGNDAAAEWETEQIREIQPDFSVRGWLATYPMSDIGQQRRLVEALGRLAL
jgi:DNA-binding winged helix-turn-helix (wHTH) protein/TolB-like protein